MEWSGKIELLRRELAVCVVCEGPPPTPYRLRDLPGQPPIHMACTARLLVVSESVRRGEPLSDTHRRWLAEWAGRRLGAGEAAEDGGTHAARPVAVPLGELRRGQGGRQQPEVGDRVEPDRD
jgi:hypothetical protein